MSVRIRLPALFADRIDGMSTVEVTATTVADALRALTDRHAELTTLVWTGDGALNPVMILLNDRQLAGDGMPVNPVMILFLNDRQLAGDGALNPVMILFLNDRQLAGDGIAQTLHAGDRLEIIPAIEGG